MNTTVTDNTLEIRLYWAGKGTTIIPKRGNYGSLISAISVCPSKWKFFGIKQHQVSLINFLIHFMFLFSQVMNLNVAVRKRNVQSFNPIFGKIYVWIWINLSPIIFLVYIFSSSTSSSSQKSTQTKNISSHSRHNSLDTLSCFLDFRRILLEEMC